MEISTTNLILFFALIMPGFLSMRVYGLFQPLGDQKLKENILEAVAFSIANFALMWWAIIIAINEIEKGVFSPKLYILIIIIFFAAPVIWPILLNKILPLLIQRGVILSPYKTAWDDVFLRRQQYWIVVHLPDQRRIGGLFGEKSYATLYPESGHIYLEELWELDDQGKFVDKIPTSKGIILRPSDYAMIELFGAEQESGPLDG